MRTISVELCVSSRDKSRRSHHKCSRKAIGTASREATTFCSCPHQRVILALIHSSGRRPAPDCASFQFVPIDHTTPHPALCPPSIFPPAPAPTPTSSLSNNKSHLLLRLSTDCCVVFPFSFSSRLMRTAAAAMPTLSAKMGSRRLPIREVWLVLRGGRRVKRAGE